MSDLENIKKHYGENMMHLCRQLFPSILEHEGLLFSILSQKFAYSKLLYDDIIKYKKINNFKDYIYSFSKQPSKTLTKTDKTPYELMDEAGYVLYECKTEDDIQRFRKYYRDDEVLCTMTQGNRLDRCDVFFAVKKNVHEINRKDFLNPQRQDEYGTSVISIQFTKGETNTLSIKNRYNHTVLNPDSTFSNNLDNIIEGLTYSFSNTFGYNIESGIGEELELPGYVRANDGKFYKYNYEMDNIYYCPNNIIIDNFEVKELDKSRYIICDRYILDLKEKRILGGTNASENFINSDGEIESVHIEDNAYDGFRDSIGKIETVRIEKDSDNGDKEIIINDKIRITISKIGQIIKYKNEMAKSIESCFLDYNECLQDIFLPNVKKVGMCFLARNKALKKLSLPKAEIVKAALLHDNDSLEELSMPKAKIVGNAALTRNTTLKKVHLDSAIRLGNGCLASVKSLEDLVVPNLVELGEGSFKSYNNPEEIIEIIKDNQNPEAVLATGSSRTR